MRLVHDEADIHEMEQTIKQLKKENERLLAKTWGAAVEAAAAVAENVYGYTGSYTVERDMATRLGPRIGKLIRALPVPEQEEA